MIIRQRCHFFVQCPISSKSVANPKLISTDFDLSIFRNIPVIQENYAKVTCHNSFLVSMRHANSQCLYTLRKTEPGEQNRKKSYFLRYKVRDIECNL